MGNLKQTKKPKIVLVPYPAQGHVTPILKLSSSLVLKGFQPIIILPQFIYRQIDKKIQNLVYDQQIQCIQIPDGLDERYGSRPNFFEIQVAMEKTMPICFENILRKSSCQDGDGGGGGGGGGGVVCVIADLMASWVFEVAKRCGVNVVAGFWPAMLETYLLIASIPSLVSDGLVSDQGIPNQHGTLCRIPGQPEVKIETRELPWLIGTIDDKKSRFKFWKTVLNRMKDLQWLLVNSFPDENTNIIGDQLIKCTDKISKYHYPRILPVGPLSFHANTTTPMINPVSFWDEDLTCMNWLDGQKSGSVIYISFGSLVGSIGEKKIKEIANALDSLGKPFLWVIGNSWRSDLPDGFVDKMTTKGGKIVAWAPQMAVLSHKSVKCFFTHCGWNSTMEAIQCRKGMLCYPIAGDQFVNCAYIVEAWRIGARLLDDFGSRKVEDGLKLVMGDCDMDSRLARLYDKAMGEKACLSIKGNVTSFIDNLAKLTPFSNYSQNMISQGTDGTSTGLMLKESHTYNRQLSHVTQK